ncbi:hypothetical protein AMECASPLE_013524 [Ameca splendens]|uniref:Uncharacterized protein n=1 Tax=Ameca splendens TaxID=208324 RepID=A0ABV0ZX77_9TELE
MDSMCSISMTPVPIFPTSGPVRFTLTGQSTCAERGVRCQPKQLLSSFRAEPSQHVHKTHIIRTDLVRKRTGFQPEQIPRADPEPTGKLTELTEPNRLLTDRQRSGPVRT